MTASSSATRIDASGGYDSLMPFESVLWEYLDEITSSKIQQMQENIVTHDHRPDGSQGAPLWGEWVDLDGITAASGWSLGATKRYRSLLGGRILQLDIFVNRTGPSIDAQGAGAANPGNVADTVILTGLPAEARAPSIPFATDVGGTGLAMLRANADGSIEYTSATTSGGIRTGQTVPIKATLWRA